LFVLINPFLGEDSCQKTRIDLEFLRENFVTYATLILTLSG